MYPSYPIRWIHNLWYNVRWIHCSKSKNIASLRKMKYCKMHHFASYSKKAHRLGLVCTKPRRIHLLFGITNNYSAYSYRIPNIMNSILCWYIFVFVFVLRIAFYQLFDLYEYLFVLYEYLFVLTYNPE